MQAYNIKDICEAYEYLKETLLKAASVCIPTYNKKRQRPIVPWWNKQCKIERKIVRKTYKQMKRNPSTINIIAHRRAEARKKRVFKEAKRTSWIDYISDLTAKFPTAKVWDRIRKIKGKYQPKPNPTINHNNTIVTNPKEVPNIFAEYYADTSKGTGLKPQKSLTKIKQKTGTSIEEQQDINELFNMRELKSVLKKVKSTSPGHDNIHNKMIQNLSDTGLHYLLDLYNRMWLENYLPPDWKISKIIPILKPNKNPNEKSSYRPISLTSCLSKVFESMVNNKIV